MTARRRSQHQIQMAALIEIESSSETCEIVQHCFFLISLDDALVLPLYGVLQGRLLPRRAKGSGRRDEAKGQLGCKAVEDGTLERARGVAICLQLVSAAEPSPFFEADFLYALVGAGHVWRALRRRRGAVVWPCLLLTVCVLSSKAVEKVLRTP